MASNGEEVNLAVKSSPHLRSIYPGALAGWVMDSFDLSMMFLLVPTLAEVFFPSNYGLALIGTWSTSGQTGGTGYPPKRTVRNLLNSGARLRSQHTPLVACKLLLKTGDTCGQCDRKPACTLFILIPKCNTGGRHAEDSKRHKRRFGKNTGILSSKRGCED